ncbi:inositol hexakisphosphate and diphosphoinositol-pentakisphosphate kinase 1-like [Notothenia coriiceps]|uniref:Inositol hexakisphosphate and diphosphoinositol-pentakisphosphate kinase 1-like n=1 Tax=Notothenia coriiceps TaxID=8208 RepID=A0A6I9MUK4_9TELE|nr:PREDICTED: inositol hexakisphosphate and diphosphoinositol-pentakisphosphate kinase 1-like [Notothenia coriiceps]
MDYLSAVTELNYMTQIVIMLYEDNNKDPSSEERFHVEIHFSPGVKGCEDEENVPLGFGFRPASSENQDKKPNQGSLEDLSQDQLDQALPLSDPINIQRKSPMIRNRKTGSMEVLSETSPSQSSKGSTSHRLFPSSCSRQSPEIKAASGLGGKPCSGVCVCFVYVCVCGEKDTLTLQHIVSPAVITDPLLITSPTFPNLCVFQSVDLSVCCPFPSITLLPVTITYFCFPSAT